jgi:hypothetical protein
VLITEFVKFCFAIPAQNLKIKPGVSLMQSQWTKERKRPSGESMKGILLDKTILETCYVNK